MDVFYTYSREQQAARDELIQLIEAEKRAFMSRIDPYLKRLADIQGTAHTHITAIDASHIQGLGPHVSFLLSREGIDD